MDNKPCTIDWKLDTVTGVESVEVSVNGKHEFKIEWMPDVVMNITPLLKQLKVTSVYLRTFSAVAPNIVVTKEFDSISKFQAYCYDGPRAGR